MSTNEKSSLPLFDPQTVFLCVRDADGTIHALHPDAPDVEPWALCGRELDPGARFVLRFGPMIFAGLGGARLESPERCPDCLPLSDADRAQTLAGRLKLFAWMAGETEYDLIRRHLDAGTVPEREGRLGAVAVTLEALDKLRGYVESGDLSREDYDAVVEELRNGPPER